MSGAEGNAYSSQDGAEISKLAKINPQNLFKKGKGFHEDDQITQEDIKQKWKKHFTSGQLKTYLKAEANAALFNRAKQVVERMVQEIEDSLKNEDWEEDEYNREIDNYDDDNNPAIVDPPKTGVARQQKLVK